MIKANELRIGNWVSNGEKNYTVDVNMLYDMVTLEHYEMFPIPLTTDILEKCGFEKWSDGYDLQAGRVSFRFTEEEDRFVLYVQPDIGLKGFIIPNNCYADTYLHSFQNFYYSLLNEELTITNL